MGHKPLRFRKAPTVFLGVTSMLCVATPLHARATAVPGKPAQTEDASRREIDNFNRFLESHHDVAVQLHSTPWLVDNYNYLQSHPELKAYLQDHPGVKQEISQNPVAFMKEDSQRSELAQFARFLDTHREVGEQLRNDPMLADNSNFLRSHPELRGYLDEHPAVKQALHENAVTFMQEEDGFNRYAGRGDRDDDARNGDTDRDRDANSNGRDRDADARNRDADKRAPDADARDRDADARNVRVADFELAFARLSQDEQTMLAALYRDRLDYSTAASLLQLSTRTLAYKLPAARQHLAQILDRLDLL